MSFYKILIALVILIAVVYFLGPSPENATFSKKFPAVPDNLEKLVDSLNTSEATLGNIKEGNEAQIIFYNDSIKEKTEWVLVYIHGFSASAFEGDPVHREFAKRYGMNLYLARLSDHGIDEQEPLKDYSAERVWKSAKEALAIGKKLGDKVVLMSTSTGGTLSILLASMYPDKVDALINYSPNIRVNDPAAFLLNDPWGLHIARIVKGSDYNVTGSEEDETARYWNNRYRLEAVVNLQELVESSMTEEIFQGVTCPSLTVAYYKDEENQDPTVKVEAMEWMNEHIATPADKKQFVKLPDVGVHPLASGLLSKDIESVQKVSYKFAEEVLGLRAKN